MSALASASPARPQLAVTYEGQDSAFLDRVLPLVDCLEVTPDALAHYRDGSAEIPAATLAGLQQLSRQKRLLVHGVGLSIGSYDGWSETYLSLLEMLLPYVNASWHSEHLAYTSVEGESLGTMLALPRTEEALELVCRRVQELQRRIPLPFLLEHVVHLLPDYPAEYSDAAFLNELVTRTGCGLILDVYNLECDAHNYGFPVETFLADLNLAAVREIHLAGGVIHQGFRLDVHSRATNASTRELAKQVLAAAPGVQVITYELLREAVPAMGYEAIAVELHQLRDTFHLC